MSRIFLLLIPIQIRLHSHLIEIFTSLTNPWYGFTYFLLYVMGPKKMKLKWRIALLQQVENLRRKLFHRNRYLYLVL